MSLHFTYDQTPELSYDFARYYAKSNRGMKIVFGLILLALGLQLANVFSRDGFSWEGAFTVLLPAAMVLLIWLWLLPKVTRKQIERADKNNKIGRGREMIFREEDFLVKTPQSEATFDYEALLYYAHSELSYFLFISSNQAMILPRAAMTAEETRAFEALLERKGVPFKG